MTEEDKKKKQQQADATQVAPSAPAMQFDTAQPQLNPNMHPYQMGEGVVQTPQFNGARARLGATQGNHLTYGDQLARQSAEANLELNQARFHQQQAIEEFNKAAEQRRSAYQAAVEMMNPKKQEKFSEDNVNREKRRAIATSLGNLLSAIAGGAMAGAGVGLGYVPQTAPNKALARLSELEADYLKAGEEYQTALQKLKMGDADSELEAAGQKVDAAGKRVKAAQKGVENADKRRDKLDYDVDKATRAQKNKEALAILNSNLRDQSNAKVSTRRKDEATHRNNLSKELDDHRTDNRIKVNKTKPKSSKGGKDDEPTDEPKPTSVTTSRKKREEEDKVAAAGLDIES